MTSFILHVIAMFTMLLDHMWGTCIVDHEIFTCIGRLAFPIFAFMTVEGYMHTSDRKKYIKRMFIFALIAEIPFNYMIYLRPYGLFHQNVLWTFLISLLMIQINEKNSNKKIIPRILIGIGTSILGGLLGILLSTDYNAAGVLMVLTFYFFRNKTWYNLIIQILFMYYINVEMLGGLAYEFNILGLDIFFHQQSIAILSLIPIWLYSGKQGPYNKTIKNIYWWFYPVHMVVLVLISQFII